MIERKDKPVEEVVPAKEEYTHMGSIQIPKGMKLYYFNKRTCNFGEVPITKTEHKVDFKTGTTSKRSTSTHDKDNMYVLAINAKNAVRKLNKTDLFKANDIKIRLK